MKTNRHGGEWKDPKTHPARRWPKHGRARAKRNFYRALAKGQQVLSTK